MEIPVYSDTRGGLMGTMNVDLGIWGKLIRAAQFLFFIAFLLLIAMWYLPQIRTNERLRRHILQLDGEIQKAQQEGRR